MAVSQADIDALTSAIANGERSVSFRDGRQVQYHSPQDLIAARDYLVRLKADEDAVATRKPRRRAVRLYYAGRGFR
ncbi:hypothetical protein E6C76_20195 [Pseudothauera nasutitermitis]|uniref:GpW n=1 Tax=Pseudothauera nasutitermitis TaxID=2565930 RepID=A0A4S4AP60_9RHOO|nr:hypothetical protein [Pseudothauera nasutitermitis]THF61406.1 hypothetical protein E6C76_20195 [Pseudothauera nasutitermitis]